MRSNQLVICIFLALIACTGGLRADTPAKASQPIRKIKLIVRTADDFGASTTEPVWFSLGPTYEWTLQTPGRTPFTNGAIDTFELPPQGLHVEDIKYIRLRKAHGDDWLLQGIELWIDGRPYYRNGEINQWLEGEKNEWMAPDFPRKK